MSNESETHKLVQEQFGPVAAAYTLSIGHANPEALQQVVVLAQPQPTDHALDIATGAGHTALALAPHVAQVIAYDLTPQMLEETNRNATERGLANLQTQQGPAEALPFAKNSFEIVTCRTAAHHFADIKQAVAEMARVITSGGRVVVVDTTVPEDDRLDQEINYLEKLRDPSHIRNYRPSEWSTMFEEVGLKVTYLAQDHYTEQGHMNFINWTSRIRTSGEAVTELAQLFRQASPALQVALEITFRGDKDEDIFFTLPKVTIVGQKVTRI
ncbi:MAG: methyltransferase domain-containing protein [Chloroflexi bacterium]|nr:methyltransferase domain-containing protein [Chloroflexota bacterium]